MQPRPGGPGRAPDLLCVAREHRDRLRPTWLEGLADLVVARIAPERISRDRGAKEVRRKRPASRVLVDRR
jgi:hypothetical protein